MNPKAQQLTCVCILKFWGFFSWVLATTFKCPLFGHKGVLMGSLKGEGILVGSGLGDIWASEKDIGKPKSEALSTTYLPCNEDHWETRDSTTEEGTGLKGHT